MKNHIIFTAVLLTCACRSIQQRSSSMLHSDKTIDLNRITSGQLFRQQDSSSRYWMFRTDTTFYFHPDSGLFAKGGSLWIREIQLHKNLGQQIYDSLKRKEHDQQQVTGTTFYKRMGKEGLWIILAVVLIMMVRR